MKSSSAETEEAVRWPKAEERRELARRRREESWGEPADHWRAGRLAGACREPGGTDGIENMVPGVQITTGSGVNLSGFPRLVCLLC